MSVFPITKQDVLDVAPQLSSTSAAAWLGITAYVNEYDLTEFDGTDSETFLARVYLAAHIAQSLKSAAAGAAGPVTSESVGGVRRSYGLIASVTTDSALTSTRYGQLFLTLLIGTTAGMPMLV